MPRPIQPSSFNYQIPTLIQGVATSAPASGSTGYVPGGALSLQVPDNTVIGGDPRGAGAIDLQVARTSSTQVASGTNSVVLGSNSLAGGANSMALGYQAVANSSSAVAIYNSTTSSSSSFAAFNSNITRSDSTSAYALFSSTLAGNAGMNGTIAMGSSSANGSGATNCFAAVNSNIPGFANNVVAMVGSTAYETAVLIGNSSNSINHNALAMRGSAAINSGTALHSSNANGGVAINNSTATNGVALISSTANASGIAIGSSTTNQSGAVAMLTANSSQRARFVYAGNCVFSAAGDCQTSIFLSRAATTTNTPVVLTSDGAAAGTTNQLIAASNLVIAFTGELIGKQSGSANIAAYTIQGTLVNNAGTVTMPTGTLTLIGTDTISLDTAPTLAADNTNKGLTVTSGSKTTTNIRWVCTLRTTEVLYA